MVYHGWPAKAEEADGGHGGAEVENERWTEKEREERANEIG